MKINLQAKGFIPVQVSKMISNLKETKKKTPKERHGLVLVKDVP